MDTHIASVPLEEVNGKDSISAEGGEENFAAPSDLEFVEFH